MATILFIEDNLEIRENTAEMLELSGHEVLVANDGNMGLEIATTRKPHVILCDIQMPELGGYDVFRKLKENASTSEIPFVFVTASAEKREMQAGLALGANAYIRKPFELEELLDAIEQCLDKE